MEWNTTVIITSTIEVEANYEVSKTERIIEAIVLTVIALTALVGNVSLWFIIIPYPRLRTCSNALILCLSGKY